VTNSNTFLEASYLKLIINILAQEKKLVFHYSCYASNFSRWICSYNCIVLLSGSILR